MDILIILIMVLGVVAYVGYPLWGSGADPRAGKRRKPAVAPAAGPLPDQEELELDREAGRLAVEDYAGLRGSEALPSAGEVEDEIERRVRALRAKRAQGKSPERDAPPKRPNKTAGRR